MIELSTNSHKKSPVEVVFEAGIRWGDCRLDANKKLGKHGSCVYRCPRTHECNNTPSELTSGRQINDSNCCVYHIMASVHSNVSQKYNISKCKECDNPCPLVEELRELL